MPRGPPWACAALILSPLPARVARDVEHRRGVRRRVHADEVQRVAARAADAGAQVVADERDEEHAGRARRRRRPPRASAICMYVVPDAIGTRTPASHAAPSPPTRERDDEQRAARRTRRRCGGSRSLAAAAVVVVVAVGRRARATPTRYAVIEPRAVRSGRERELGACAGCVSGPAAVSPRDVERERRRDELHVRRRGRRARRSAPASRSRSASRSTGRDAFVGERGAVGAGRVRARRAASKSAA